jgi:uncharacterized protein
LSGTVRRSERVYFPGGSGYELSGILDLPSDEPQAVAVFTHCFTCSKDLKAIVRISRGLAELGYAVLRYDLTGLGGSAGDFSHTDFRSNRADLTAAVEFVTQRLAAPSFLIGHSFGGACSLSLTESFPGVRGTVSLASPSDTAHLAKLLARLNPAIEAHGEGVVNIGGFEYSIRPAMLEDFRTFDLPALLQRVTKPVLLFHSPVDETLGFEHALRLYGLLTQRAEEAPPPSPASLICIPDADHLLVRNPADLRFVTHMIAAWFERILANATGLPFAG